MDLNVLHGKTVALVGASGCGKSTCIQLLQRFYDPDSGNISLGKENISYDMTTRDLRSRMCIVPQEPVLFDRTIAENITFGSRQNSFMTFDIIEAAKLANIHEFVTSLPLVQ